MPHLDIGELSHGAGLDACVVPRDRVVERRRDPLHPLADLGRHRARHGLVGHRLERLHPLLELVGDLRHGLLDHHLERLHLLLKLVGDFGRLHAAPDQELVGEPAQLLAVVRRSSRVGRQSLCRGEACFQAARNRFGQSVHVLHLQRVSGTGGQSDHRCLARHLVSDYCRLRLKVCGLAVRGRTLVQGVWVAFGAGKIAELRYHAKLTSLLVR